MGSTLVITSVESLQKKINKSVKDINHEICIYVSLNKTQKSIEDILKQNKINTKRIFFIDCVTSKQKKDDVLHISPRDLDKLLYAIQEFVREVKLKKSIIIDALSTLLIYNDENKVAAFIKEVTGFASENGVEIIAFSPSTKGEDLLNKIFNFFDEVKKEDDGNKINNKGDIIF